ncbi:hypothetical protein E4U55_007713 [Claviceps digitariae]|nr:hypothetical protein E4U55_007713 [Claviceps digitariae]
MDRTIFALLADWERHVDDVPDALYGFVACAPDGDIRDRTQGRNLVKARLGADNGADNVAVLEEENAHCLLNQTASIDQCHDEQPKADKPANPSLLLLKAFLVALWSRRDRVKGS